MSVGPVNALTITTVHFQKLSLTLHKERDKKLCLSLFFLRLSLRHFLLSRVKNRETEETRMYYSSQLIKNTPTKGGQIKEKPIYSSSLNEIATYHQRLRILDLSLTSKTSILLRDEGSSNVLLLQAQRYVNVLIGAWK